MFIFFANCLIFIFLFDETSSKSTEIQHQNSSQFWHNLIQKNGICDEQMADEMDKSDSFFEKLSKEENYKPPRQSPKQPAFEPNQLKHPGKQSLFFKLFKLDNFYELVKGQGEAAKLMQDLAKTFINIKSSLIKNGKIEITTILDKTENAVNFLAKQNKIKIVHEKVMKIELPEIVKSLATILSEMRRAKNCGENAKEIVNLWQSVKQNDEFKKYFGNKSEGKNRRLKRRTYGHGPYSQEYILICVGVIVLLCIFLLGCYFYRKCSD